MRLARFLCVIALILSALVAIAEVGSSLAFDEMERSRSTASLPQNIVRWAVAEVWSKQYGLNDSASVVYADVIRRELDGLVIVRPVNWYVYYKLGGKFYYLTNVARGCSSSECSAVMLTPTMDHESRRSTLREVCLNASLPALLSLFTGDASCHRLRVPLDKELEQRRHWSSPMTVINVLNMLIERSVL